MMVIVNQIKAVSTRIIKMALGGSLGLAKEVRGEVSDCIRWG